MKAKKSSAKKVAKTTTLSVGTLERAQKLMENIFNYSDFNDLLDRLITDEYERRYGKIMLDKDETDPPNEESFSKQKKKVAW